MGSFVRCNDMWFARDNRFLNPVSTYGYIRVIFETKDDFCPIFSFQSCVARRCPHVYEMYNGNLRNYERCSDKNLAIPKARMRSVPKTFAIFLSGVKYCLLSGSCKLFFLR